MSTVEHVVIAAAGLGSRLGFGKPKCLVEIEGKPIIAHLLKLLDDIKDIRLVVGFCEDDVIETVIKIRSDIIFVRNPNFRSTKTIESYAMASKGVKQHTLFMDADILFDPASFANFINSCYKRDVLVGITDTKTVDSVFVNVLENNQITSFSRFNKSKYEWANIVFAPSNYFENSTDDVYKLLEKCLPLQAQYINSFEVDRQEDLEQAKIYARNNLIDKGRNITPLPLSRLAS